jgi:hypothetical protein
MKHVAMPMPAAAIAAKMASLASTTGDDGSISTFESALRNGQRRV